MCWPDLSRWDAHITVTPVTPVIKRQPRQALSALTMPSSEQKSPRRRDAGAQYSYRRSLGLRELLPAIGIAVGAGFFAFYVTKLLLQRTPLMLVKREGG